MTTRDVIVVGAGKWGINHILTAERNGSLVAVVDGDEAALRNAQQRCSTPVAVYRCLSEALGEHDRAAVVVAASSSAHYALAERAINADRHVLVEKPFCDTLAHARLLVRLAHSRRVVLMVDHLLRYSHDHAAMIQLATSGYIGRVTRISMVRLKFGTIRTEENVLWSFCPHDISVMLAVCGDGGTPCTVSCSGQRVVSDAMHDHVDLGVDFDSGVSARIEASWTHPFRERRTVVYGEHGCIVLNEEVPHADARKLHVFKWSAQQAARNATKLDAEMCEDCTYMSHTPKWDDDERESTPLEMVHQALQRAIRGEKTAPTTGEEGVRVMEILDAASASLAKGGEKVEVDSERCGKVFTHASAFVDEGAMVGDGSKVWHGSHIMAGARVGRMCNIGQNVYIGGGVVMGSRVKVQNNVSIYDGVRIGDDVFLGPSCVFTNVKTPRAHVCRNKDYSETVVEDGATVGANATIVCGVALGRFCLVGAGAVVTKNVAEHAMVYGNPARVHGWVSTSGAQLKADVSEGCGKELVCGETGERYRYHADGADGGGTACVVKL